jgi:type III secretory pathway component EscV
MRNTDVTKLVLGGTAALLSLLLLLRFLPFLRFFLFLILAVALVVVLWWWWRQDWEAKATTQDFEQTTVGQIQSRLHACREQVEKLHGEQQQILKSKQELEKQLRAGRQLPESVTAETRRLVHGFEQENTLRQTKVLFYQQCAAKLESLLEQHELLATLERKKLELEQYREQHYDDIAAMEALRWDVEREATSLEVIQDLSTRMQRSSGLEDVLHLQKELEKILAS